MSPVRACPSVGKDCFPAPTCTAELPSLPPHNTAPGSVPLVEPTAVCCRLPGVMTDYNSQLLRLHDAAIQAYRLDLDVNAASSGTCCLFLQSGIPLKSHTLVWLENWHKITVTTHE